MHHRQVHFFLSLILAALLLCTVYLSMSWAAPASQADGQVYVVKAGDSLFKIAASFYGNGNVWPMIVEATNQKAQEDSTFATISDPRRLRVGQKLWIPNQPNMQPAAPAQPTPTELAPAQPTPTQPPPAEPASVRFVEPANGATVSPTVMVQMAASGLTVEPAGEIHEGAGHMHILVDTDFVPPGEVVLFDDQHLHFGKGQLTTTLELEPGVHVLRLQFANGAHMALGGEEYQDTITVTVAGEATQPGVRFVEPADGATVLPQFAVEMAASGLTVEPAGEIHEGAGHMHILVDTDFTPPGEVILTDDQHLHFGRGQLTTTLELEPGVHVLRLQFANGAHIALDGEQYQDTITVTVEGETTQPGVRFVEPIDGATVPPQFAVEMAASGLTVEPAGEINEGAGHMHILVDTDFTPPGDVILTDDQHLHFGRGQLTTTLELEPGVHVLHLQFANGAHIALDGEAYQDTITVTVEGETTEPGVRFVEPADGATLPPQFAVEMAASGLIVEPAGAIHEGAGHMHILVDTDFVAPGDVILTDDQHLHFGKGQLTTTLELEPGTHVLRLQFANGAHIALEGEQYQDTITVTVAGEAAQPGVRFVEPVDGATVPPEFAVEMAASGLTVEPAGEINEGAGHMHILIDTDFTPPGDVILTDEQHLHFGRGQLTTTLELEPGVHVLRLQFANGAHIALEGEEYHDEITVTVAE